MNFKNLSFFPYTVLFFIGIANALPIPLASSTLSIWLTDYGFSKDAIGLFALLSLPLSAKLLWYPVITSVSMPFFRNSPRKGWLLFALFGMAVSLICTSLVDPVEHTFLLACTFISLYSFMGCLYVVGIAYELECLEEDSYRKGSASFLMGFRCGFLIAGGGALYVASTFNWPFVFMGFSLLLFLGFIIVLTQKEPFKSAEMLKIKREEISRYNSLFQSFWHEIVLKPCKTFFQRRDAIAIILVILTFNIGDNFAKAMEGPFLLSLGFNKLDLAFSTNMFGFAATILGAIFAGFCFRKADLLKLSVILGAVHAFTLMSYYILTIVGKSFFYLYVAAAVDSFTAGMAMTILTSLLWKICDRRYAIVQYALLWSLYSFKAEIFTCLGGFFATELSWGVFFFLAATLSTLTSLLIFSKVRSCDPLRTIAPC